MMFEFPLTGQPFPPCASKLGLCVERFYRVIKPMSGVWHCVYSEYTEQFSMESWAGLSTDNKKGATSNVKYKTNPVYRGTVCFL